MKGHPWLCFPGFVSQILNSPISLVGTVGQSVSVVCPYEKIYENNTKYWCKSPCLWKIVETAVPDVEAWNGRVSIRDVSATLSFRVTMRNLREEDAGTYRCGIDTSEFPGYLFDLTYPVVVTVTPGELCIPLPRHQHQGCLRLGLITLTLAGKWWDIGQKSGVRMGWVTQDTRGVPVCVCTCVVSVYLSVCV